MLYNAFLEGVSGQTWTAAIQNYPTFTQHLNSRFSNAKLLYDEQTTLNLLQNLLINHKIKIKQIEMLINVEFDISDLGISTTTQSSTAQNQNGSSKQSYIGYNVDSDYSGMTTNNTGMASGVSKSNVIDKLKETAEIASSEIARLFDEIDEDLWTIFKQLY